MSYLSDLEHTKLNALVQYKTVTEIHYISDPNSGQRRVPKTKIWNVERLLGKGSFGEVRLEVSGPEQRAVKKIWATGSTFKVDYERELKALLEFSKPKYKEAAVFVDFMGWYEDSDHVYLAMEYIPLGDLEQNTQAQGGIVPENGIREIVVQILEGLKIMHLENFVHRDLKPKVGQRIHLVSCTANLWTEHPSLSRRALVVGQTCRFWTEQKTNRRYFPSHTNWNTSIYGA